MAQERASTRSDKACAWHSSRVSTRSYARTRSASLAPVAQLPCGTFDADRAGKIPWQPHAQRALRVGAVHLDAASEITVEDGGIGMVEAIAVTDGQDAHGRRDRVDERIGRRRLRAMVRHEQHI